MDSIGFVVGPILQISDMTRFIMQNCWIWLVHSFLCSWALYWHLIFFRFVLLLVPYRLCQRDCYCSLPLVCLSVCMSSYLSFHFQLSRLCSALDEDIQLKFGKWLFLGELQIRFELHYTLHTFDWITRFSGLFFFALDEAWLCLR
jgi:hypothetical protein